MLPIFLLVTGGAVSFYALWQLRRWLTESEGRLVSAPKRLESIVDELVATAEEASSAVAERTEQLASVVARADDRLKSLETALAAGTVSAAAGPASAEPHSPVPGPAPGPAEQVAPLPRAASPAEEPYQAFPEPTRQGSGLPSDPPESHRRVYRLADAGQDLTAIARQTGMTKGEVQLILGLRRIH